MRSARPALVLGLMLASPSAFAIPLPVDYTGQMCDLQSTCTPLRITVQRAGALTYSGTVGGLTANGVGTWQRTGRQVTTDDGPRMSFSGLLGNGCYVGSGTFLGQVVQFEICR